jgi:broad specificity phosphatase PhoE
MVAGTYLTWICHAPTSATRRSAFPVDEAIEERGRLQANSMAQYVAAHDRAYVAPEQRTLQTAKALQLDASTEIDLKDCDYGRWAGQSLAGLGATEAEAIAAWLSDGKAKPHGGESIAEAIGRVAAWLDRQAAPRGRLVAVSHPAIVRAAIIHVLGAPPASFWRIDVPPLSQTHMSNDGKRWKLVLPKSVLWPVQSLLDRSR